MKRINFHIALFILFVPIYGQSEPIKIQDPLAEPVLDQLASFFSSGKGMQIEFRYEIESKADKYKLEDKGTILVKGNKYKMKTEELEVLYNGEKMWTYNSENEEVYVSKPDPGDMDQMLVAPFILLTDYKNYFKYRFKGEQKSGSQVFYEVDLYPVSLDCSYSILRIRTNRSGGGLHSFSMQQKNGVWYNVYITSIHADIKISEDTFNWNKELYPDVLIIEL